MILTEKSLCVFIHFEKTGYIPRYVEMYVNELSIHFTEVIFVQNKREFHTNLPDFKKNVSLHFVANEGYDLGMFYKVFKTINHIDYKHIACINDSNILFKSLTSVISWSAKQKCDFWGLIDSYEKPWFSTHENTYHLQSHFVVFNEKAIALLPEFFEKINVDSIISEKDIKQLRRTVINEWEIGLTQYLILNGLKPASYVCSKSFSKEYSTGKAKNLTIRFFPQLIKSGYPLLKKKVIFGRTWKEKLRFQPSWESLLIKFGQNDWEISSMIEDLVRIGNGSVKKYNNSTLEWIRAAYQSMRGEKAA
ncbi:MAG TPA: hypothetical protein DCR40_12605 [Prolixibacteraceae bacterium]|nr:MAG: hypothetical protein A2066_09905 [Bacteroidetes bacterium GWB2_41_8]HAQ20052.1 hypothetical protein [Prolixibacteraceae bacterium]